MGTSTFFDIPNNPIPREQHPGNLFGITWGGQHKICRRLIKGADIDELLPLIERVCPLTGEQHRKLVEEELPKLELLIPYIALSLQDAINLAIVMIRTTIDIQRFIIDVQGCGGAIDVAVITRDGGFQWIQQKSLHGEFSYRSLLI